MSMKKLMNSLIFVLFQGFIFAIEPVAPEGDHVSERLQEQVEKAEKRAIQQGLLAGQKPFMSATPSDSDTSRDVQGDKGDEFTKDTGLHLGKEGENNRDNSNKLESLKSNEAYQRIIVSPEVLQNRENLTIVKNAMKEIDHNLKDDATLEKSEISKKIDNFHNANGGKSFSVLGWIKDFINKLLGGGVDSTSARNAIANDGLLLGAVNPKVKSDVVNLMITKLYREYERDFNSVVPNFSKSDLKAKYEKAVEQTESLANEILGKDGIAQNTPEWYMMKIMKINWSAYTHTS